MKNDRRKSELEATQDTVKFFEGVIGGLREGVLITDSNQNIILVNPALCDIFGETKDKIIETSLLPWLERFDNQASQRWVQLERIVRKESNNNNIELSRQVVDGERVFSTNISFWESTLGKESQCFVSIWRDITEKIKAQKAQAYLAAIIEGTDQGVIGKNLDGTIISWNTGAEKIYGYSSDEIVGKKIHTIVPEDRHGEVEKFLSLIKKGRIIDHYETIRLRKDGTPIDLLLTISPIRDINGKIIGASTLANDITERRQLEEQQRNTNELLASISYAQSRFIAYSKPKLVFLELLKKLLQLTQSEYGFIGETLYSQEGKPYLKCFNFDAIEERKEFNEFFEKNVPPNLEFHNLDNLFGETIRTGKPVITNDPSSHPMRSKKGLPPGHPPLNSYLGLPLYLGDKLLGMIGMANRPGGYDEELVEHLQPVMKICASIIETYGVDQQRQKAEQALQESHTKLEVLVAERTDDLLKSKELMAVISKAQNQFIADADPEAVFSQLLDNILSLTQSEYGFISELLYTDSAEPYIRTFVMRSLVEEEKFQSFIENFAPPNLEFYNLDNLFGEVIKTGKPVISNDPAKDPRRGKIGPPPEHPRLDSYLGLPLFHGQVLVGMIGIANRPGGYDEQLAKFLEPFLITGANILEAYKNDQRRKAAEEKLNTAQKQILTSQKLAGIGQLAAGVSHEVLNPVNIISVHTQMLERKRKDDPDLQTFCSKLKNEIKRIEKIMSSLLLFSRKGESQYEKIAVGKVIEEVIDFVDNDFSLDNISIETEFCEPYCEVLADKDKMRQVFLNLINNAKHAMPQGGNLILRTQRHILEGCKFARITISDTGMGISQKNLDKVFDPFFTTKMEGKGTGMGLSVVHGIIEEHGGTITVESEEGKGATFSIDLPLS